MDSEEKFKRKIRKNYAKATVLVGETPMMLDGRLVGECGKRWFEEKVKTVYERRGRYILNPSYD